MPDRKDRGASAQALKVSGRWKVKIFPRTRIGVAPVREPRNLPRAFVEKGQRCGVRDPLELGAGVSLRLLFDCRESSPPAVRFGLDDANGLSVNEEHVVGRSDIGLVFAHRDAKARGEVDGIPVLHMPARSPEAVVDPVAGDLFGILVDVTRHGIGLVDAPSEPAGQL